MKAHAFGIGAGIVIVALLVLPLVVMAIRGQL